MLNLWHRPKSRLLQVVLCSLVLSHTVTSAQQDLSGDVRDGRVGSPVEGATVRLTGTGEPDSGQAGTVLTSARTASDGSFRIAPGLFRGVLEVSAPGYATKRMRWPGVQPTLQVSLDRGAKLAIQVTREDGTPIPGLITIQTFHPGNVVAGAMETQGGLAEFSDLPSGPTTIVVRSQGFAPAARTLHVEAGSTYALPSVSLTRAGTLRGTVIDAGSGLPVQGALIVASYGPELPFARTLANFLGRAQTASDGSFRVRNVVPGATLHAHAEYEGRRSDSVTVVLTAGENRGGEVLFLRPN